MKHYFYPKQPVVTFRHFTRKGYALFACLGREVRIGVLSVATLTAAAPLLHAQAPLLKEVVETPATEENLNEATVTASRAPLSTEVAARQVSVLRRADLATAGVQTVNDALKLAAAVDVRQRGGFGIQTDISIDGGNFDQLALYLNGIPYNHPQTGHNAADFPFALEDIERIEILEGAASKIFGAQAFSGAINIVTFSTGDNTLRITGGSYATFIAEAKGGFALGKAWTTSLSGRYFRSSGATPNSDFRGGAAFWQGRYQVQGIKIDLQAGATQKSFGANTFYTAAFPNQWEATGRYFAAVQAEMGSRIHFNPKLSWTRSTDHYQLRRDRPSFYENFNRTDVFTLGLNVWTPWKWGRTALGAEMRSEHLLSRNLGFPKDTALWVNIAGEDSLRYTRGADRMNINLYAEHDILLRQWTISLGAFAERNTFSDHRFRIFSGIDVSYRPNERWKLFASWNEAMRQPTFTELWYKSPTHEGNGALRPERNSAFRLGASFQTKGIDIHTKLFYQRGSDLIDWVQYATDGKWIPANFQIYSYGFNLTTQLSLTALLGSRQPLQRLTLGYAYIDQDRKDTQVFVKANATLEYLRHKLTATLHHRLFSHLSASWHFRLQRREGGYFEYIEGKATGAWLPYGTHAQLDCKLLWERPQYALTLDMTNLTAHRYCDFGNVPQPGFLAMAGIRLNLSQLLGH